MALDEQRVRRILKQTILDSVPDLVDTLVGKLKVNDIEIKPVEKQGKPLEYIKKPVFSDKVLKVAVYTQLSELPGLTTRILNNLLAPHSHPNSPDRIIKTVADLYHTPDEEILFYRNMGPKRLSQVNESLAAFAEQVEQDVSCV